jgi:hypothetical protein
MPKEEVKVNYGYQSEENDTGGGAFNVDVSAVQHPTVATLRYNWAILGRKLEGNAF